MPRRDKAMQVGCSVPPPSSDNRALVIAELDPAQVTQRPVRTLLVVPSVPSADGGGRPLGALGAASPCSWL